MPPSDQTVCLCMIVRDEAPVIRRCLASVRPLIDHWLIVDTGSSDGTQAIVRETMADLPGALVERPWIDFAHNRSEALSLARPRAAYSLIIDADDEIILPPRFERPTLDADSYVVDIEDTSIAYQRTQLVANKIPWRYRGVLHEFLEGPGAGPAGHLPIVMRRNHDGARRRDPKTYSNDAAILEEALRKETDPFLIARYTFYLAQSYRDCGERERALSAYLRRAGQGFWDQEIYVSLLGAGRLMEGLGHPLDVVLGVYRAANAACGNRAEAAHAASRLCRQHDRFAEGYAFAAAAINKPAPIGGLFVERWIYAYGLADEYAVHAYWTGRYRDCLVVCDRLLSEGRAPADMRPRIEANRRFAIERLSADADAGESAKTQRPAGVGWAPSRPLGGTEIMAEGLRRRMGAMLDKVNLRVNLYDETMLDKRPLVLWIQHDIDQQAVQWLRDKQKAARVDRFVFVSNWQRARYITHFDLNPDRCLVLRNATEAPNEDRPWTVRKPWKMAYASTPYRGLSVLLDAWDRLRPNDAELHIWSSHRLYGPGFDDTPYEPMFERARSMANVFHHGVVPNDELRAALRDCDFLTYPNIFAETSCITAIEAMAAGCRVICPSLGALPETVGRFGRVYPYVADAEAHAARFAEVLAEEIAQPWGGAPALAIEQQRFVRREYDWSVRVPAWRELVQELAAKPLAGAAPIAPATPTIDRLHRALTRLRESGFAPTGVLDIGAYEGLFAREVRGVFPDAHILMIDALAENEEALKQVSAEIGAAYAIAMLGDADCEAIPFFVVDTERRPDLVKTGASKFRERTDFPMRERSVAQRRLDSLIAPYDPPYGLIKLDVQGAELDVLRGLGARLADAEIILMEMSLVEYNEGAPLIAEALFVLENMGFVLCEIVEEHRHRDGALLQVDGLFARPTSRFRAQPPFWA
jgi:FkbM family methyltransferase